MNFSCQLHPLPGIPTAIVFNPFYRKSSHHFIKELGLFIKVNISENISVVIGIWFINNSFHFWAKCFAYIGLLNTYKNLVRPISLSHFMLKQLISKRLCDQPWYTV